MLEILQNIGNIIELLFRFFERFTSNLFDFINFLINCLPFATYISSLAPGILGASCTVIISVAVVKFVVSLKV